MKKRIFSLLLAAVLLVGLLPAHILAAEAEEVTAVIRAGSLTTDPTVVTQGQNITVEFDFELFKGLGETFTAGESVTLPTNMGELFRANWAQDFAAIPIVDSEGTILAHVAITEREVIITVAEGGDGAGAIGGSVTTQHKLTAKNVGAVPGTDVDKELFIGEETTKITFQQKEWRPEATADPVDIDLFWKNGASNQTQTGATFFLEVNPIGSMDLYGSTTYQEKSGGGERKPRAHKNMMIEDTIPEHGYIVPESVQIYAAVPTIGVRDSSFEKNGYDVPAGVYYAVRSGTLRWSLNGTDSSPVRMTKLTQEADETFEAFKARVAGEQLQWGIYRDAATKTETFLCNFGNVGKFEDGTPNNGVVYSDYMDRDYGKKYPEIFGKEGASAGNIVSYYIEFNTYYPDVAGKKKLLNTARFTSSAQSGDRSADFTINNGMGTGVARRNELILKLVDKNDPSAPIAGAEFRVQQQTGDSWVDTKLTGVTDENGKLTFGPFPNGTYRAVQTSTAAGYQFDNKTFGLSDVGDALVNGLTETGEFTVTPDNRKGFASIVTNWGTPHTLTYTYDGTEPSGLMPPEPVSTKYNAQVELAVPTAEGSIFLGWRVLRPANESVQIEGGTLTMPNEDVVLVGSWKRNESGEGGGESGTDPTPLQFYYRFRAGDHGSLADLAGFALEREETMTTRHFVIPQVTAAKGFTFVGWKDETGADLTEADILALPALCNKTFTAQYQKNEPPVPPTPPTPPGPGHGGGSTTPSIPWTPLEPTQEITPLIPLEPVREIAPLVPLEPAQEVVPLEPAEHVNSTEQHSKPGEYHGPKTGDDDRMLYALLGMGLCAVGAGYTVLRRRKGF